MLTDSKFLSKIYSVYSHHFHFNVLMTVQNLFHKGLGEISLNAQIMVFFKSCRDVNQITYFLLQIYPKPYKNALDAYKSAIASKRGYLVIYLCCKTFDSQCLRSILNNQHFPKHFPRRYPLSLLQIACKKTHPLCVCFKKPLHHCKSVF